MRLKGKQIFSCISFIVNGDCFICIFCQAQDVTDAACGRVLRVKGFVQDAAGWVELNATADGLTAAPIPAGQEVLIVIGEGLDKERIEAVLRN